MTQSHLEKWLKLHMLLFFTAFYPLCQHVSPWLAHGYSFTPWALLPGNADPDSWCSFLHPGEVNSSRS